jgi:hypothetical protein
MKLILFDNLFDLLQKHEQFFSYLAAVTITDDRAANSDLCLALKVLSRATLAAARDLHF